MFCLFFMYKWNKYMSKIPYIPYSQPEKNEKETINKQNKAFKYLFSFWEYITIKNKSPNAKVKHTFNLIGLIR